MTNLTKLATLAIIATGFAASFAGVASAMVLPRHPTGEPPQHRDQTIDISCKVKDTDFYVQNFGNVTLDSGVQIVWRSPTTGDQGVILLPKPIAPGQELKLADLLSDIAAPGAPCSADRMA